MTYLLVGFTSLFPRIVGDYRFVKTDNKQCSQVILHDNDQYYLVMTEVILPNPIRFTKYQKITILVGGHVAYCLLIISSYSPKVHYEIDPHYLIASRRVGPQTLWRFRLKYLSIDERVRA